MSENTDNIYSGVGRVTVILHQYGKQPGVVIWDHVQFSLYNSVNNTATNNTVLNISPIPVHFLPETMPEKIGISELDRLAIAALCRDETALAPLLDEITDELGVIRDKKDFVPRKELIRMLKLVEWSSYSDHCSFCYMVSEKGHAKDCKLAKVLKEFKSNSD